MRTIDGRNGGTLQLLEKGETANPNGRPPKIYTVLKRKGFTPEDIRIAFGEINWYNVDELKKVFENPQTPAILKILAHVYKRAIEKGDYRYVKEIIEQAIGKPKETVDAHIKQEVIQVTFNMGDGTSTD